MDAQQRVLLAPPQTMSFGVPTKQRRFLLTMIWSPLRTWITRLTTNAPAAPTAISEIAAITMMILPLKTHLRSSLSRR